MKNMNINKKIVLCAILIGIIFTSIITYSTKNYSTNVQKDLASNLIRFHVIANSDSVEDQDLKREVRDNILKNMKGTLDKSDNIEETRTLIKKNINYIKDISTDVVNGWDKDYDVKVSLCPSYFPTKRYGDIVLPPGEYEALKVEIGKAEGKNWWCVMFPPLCFVDITHGVVPEKSKDGLKNILTEDEYDLIVDSKKETYMPVKFKFKIVEWWQEKIESNKLNFFVHNNKK